MDVILTSNQICNLFGIQSSGTLSKWKELGAKGACISRNQWDAKIFLEWWIENIFSDAQDTSDSLQEAKRVYWMARAKGEEIKVKQLEGTLFDQDTVVIEWAARVAVVTSGLNAFADRLPPLLEGKGRIEMQTIIRKETWELRDAYYRKGKYTPEVKEKKKTVKRKRPVKAKPTKKKGRKKR